MSDAASENDMKRPQMANPYLKEKPAAEALPEESPATSNYATATTTGIAKLPAENVETEPNCCTNNNNTIAAVARREPTLFGSNNEPAVERLPSRSVSFGSAEILTVTELHEHVLSYHNQSVRITGVVLHRLVVAAEDGNVCLVVSDPNHHHHQQQQRMRPSSICKMPGGGGSMQRKNGGRLVSRKRPLATVPKKTPLESAVISLAEQQKPSVLVYAISRQVPINDVAVGDLVMIIGELRSACTTATTTLAAVPAIIQTIVGHENSTTTKHFLHARIVRNVNGTDMALHDEALRMRRQHLLQKKCPESSKDHPIRQGCGPPPYYDANQKEASV